MTNPSNYGNTVGGPEPPWLLRGEVIPGGATGATGATGAAGATGPTGAAGGLTKTQVTLTAAQLAALNTTPVQLLPAPGAGKIITLVSAVVQFRVVNTVTMPSGGTIIISYTADGSTTQIFDVEFGLRFGTGNVFDPGLYNPGPFVNAITSISDAGENSPVILTSSSDIGNAGSLGGAVVTLWSDTQDVAV